VSLTRPSLLFLFKTHSTQFDTDALKHIYDVLDPKTNWGIWLFPLEGDKKPAPDPSGRDVNIRDDIERDPPAPSCAVRYGKSTLRASPTEPVEPESPRSLCDGSTRTTLALLRRTQEA
jgi:hypothetical protein